MTTAVIGCLAAGILYLAKRWSDSRAEIAQLQVQIATLKRQLTRRKA